MIRDRENYFLKKQWGDRMGNNVGSLFTFPEVVELCNNSVDLNVEEIMNMIEEKLLEKNAPGVDHPFYIEFSNIYESLKDEAKLREEERICAKAMADDKYV